MERIVLLIIMLFSFSILSLADNARFEALRDAERDVNDTVWALAVFSAPLLMGGLYMTGGTTGGTISYMIFTPGLLCFEQIQKLGLRSVLKSLFFSIDSLDAITQCEDVILYVKCVSF